MHYPDLLLSVSPVLPPLDYKPMTNHELFQQVLSRQLLSFQVDFGDI